MAAMSPLDTIVACRLHAAPGMLARVIHLPTAPAFIHVQDDEFGLDCVYRRTAVADGSADYLLDRIA